MNSGTLMTPAALRFPGLDTHGSLTGRAVKFVVVLGLHAALVIWLLQVRQDLPELRLPERVFVRLVEVAAPAPVVTPEPAPEPVPGPVKAEPPQPLPQAVPMPAPAKPPVRRAVNTLQPPPPTLTAKPQPQAVERRAPAPRAVPAVTEARFDAAYLNNPPPVYPAKSQRKREQGRVLLRVQVSAQGAAERVVIQTSSGHTRLDSAALEAVKRWHFVPARRGDRAVSAEVVVPIVFRLDAE